ncbi:MAG: hypothetical protein U5L45_09700 [Saprospiraceae bacterium]|nr:hypothetical protein [Saprospiraceae bacterium]
MVRFSGFTRKTNHIPLLRTSETSAVLYFFFFSVNFGFDTEGVGVGV